MKLRILLWSLLIVAAAALEFQQNAQTFTFADGSEPMPICRGKQCK